MNKLTGSISLEKQVCTLEQSNLLRILGVITLSQFYFFDGPTGIWDIAHRSSITEIHTFLHVIEAQDPPKKIYSDVLSAYTSSELGIMMAGSNAETTVWDDRDHSYRLPRKHGESKMFETEAECRAAQVIEMIQRKMISVDDINRRLKE